MGLKRGAQATRYQGEGRACERRETVDDDDGEGSGDLEFRPSGPWTWATPAGIFATCHSAPAGMSVSGSQLFLLLGWGVGSGSTPVVRGTHGGK